MVDLGWQAAPYTGTVLRIIERTECILAVEFARIGGQLWIDDIRTVFSGRDRRP
jgi:hypothetical protein